LFLSFCDITFFQRDTKCSQFEELSTHWLSTVFVVLIESSHIGCGLKVSLFTFVRTTIMLFRILMDGHKHDVSRDRKYKQ